MSLDVEPVFAGRLDDRRGRWAPAIVGLILVAVVVMGLLPTGPEPDVRPAPTPRTADERPTTPASPAPAPRDVAMRVAGAPLAPLGELEPGRPFAWPLDDAWARVTVPRFGWVNHGDAITSAAHGSSGSRAIIYWTWHREGALPLCPGVLRRTVSAEDLVRAISEAPGVEVMRSPGDTFLGGYRTRRLIVQVRSDDGCDPGYVYGTAFDAASTATWSSSVGDVIRIWVVALGERRLVVAVTTRGPVGDLVEEELDGIIHSMTLVGPAVEPPSAASVSCVPRVGPLEPGWYSSTVAGRGPGEGCENFLRYFLPDRGWGSENDSDGAADVRLRRGIPGAADGTFLRMGDVTDVYADPCAGTPVRPMIDSTADGLAAAIASMRGVVVAGPTSVRLRWSTARYLEVSVPDDVGCLPDAAGLWLDESGRPRTPAAAGATIRLWIFHPNDHPGFGRAVIEAETYPGTDPAVHGEIDTLVALIDHGG